MKPKIIFVSAENDQVTFSKDELYDLIEKTYNAGYEDGKMGVVMDFHTAIY